MLLVLSRHVFGRVFGFGFGTGLGWAELAVFRIRFGLIRWGCVFLFLSFFFFSLRFCFRLVFCSVRFGSARLFLFLFIYFILFIFCSGLGSAFDLFWICVCFFVSFWFLLGCVWLIRFGMSFCLVWFGARFFWGDLGFFFFGLDFGLVSA